MSGAHMQINIPLLFELCTLQLALNFTGSVVMAWLVIGSEIFTEFTGIVVLVATISAVYVVQLSPSAQSVGDVIVACGNRTKQVYMHSNAAA